MPYYDDLSGASSDDDDDDDDSYSSNSCNDVDGYTRKRDNGKKQHDNHHTLIKATQQEQQKSIGNNSQSIRSSARKPTQNKEEEEDNFIYGDGDINDNDNDNTNGENTDIIWSRSIIHLDIDCFYCQCEEIDRNLRNQQQPPRPLAIGQKHIVVTCNYEARKRGVTKLQLRENAMAACPDLLIVEGSDLQRYRRHSRNVYEAFREALKELIKIKNQKNGYNFDCNFFFNSQNDNNNHNNYNNNNNNNDNNNQHIHDNCDISVETSNNGRSTIAIPARKGTMDEMMADLSPAISHLLLNCEAPDNIQLEKDFSTSNQRFFLYGETPQSSRTVLVEDQTGQETVVQEQEQEQGLPLQLLGPGSATHPSYGLPPLRRNAHESFGNEQCRQNCSKRLLLAAQLAKYICEYILEKTGFHTTAGVSVSPLLAKIASDLNKPKSVNVLYPWRSSRLIYTMPLRKMNCIGRGIAKALEGHMPPPPPPPPPPPTQVKGNDVVRTVRDFLEMPRTEIIKSLQGMQAFQSSCDEKCDFLINRCRGLDETQIIDDEGGAQKTLSIENSFRRGTVRSMEAVWRGLLDLFVRLPLLLRDRASWSCNPEKAYPTTIRLTIRLVDDNLITTNSHKQQQKQQRRRPFVTFSKQTTMNNGKKLLDEKDPKMLIQILKGHISPLLEHVLRHSNNKNNIKDINVTRMNIALTNFQDIPAQKNTISSSLRTTENHQTSLLSLHFSSKKRTHTDSAVVGETATAAASTSLSMSSSVSASMSASQTKSQPSFTSQTKSQPFFTTTQNEFPAKKKMKHCALISNSFQAVTNVQPLEHPTTTLNNNNNNIITSHTRVSPSLNPTGYKKQAKSPAASAFAVKKEGQSQTSRPPRMKATRIDSFFWKK